LDKNKKDTVYLDELISNLNELSEEMLKSTVSSTDDNNEKTKSYSKNKS